MQKEGILKTIVVLAVLGLFVSLYLVENHYAGFKVGSACDFSERISCSLVNNSKYAELFHVPVAVFGALWMVLLGVLAIVALHKEQPAIKALLIWNVAGILFVLYMIYAELVLQALCPFCTIVHIITLVTLILSYKLYRETKPAKLKDDQILFKWTVFAALLFLIPIIAINVFAPQKDYTAFAMCLDESGVKMYGSFRCGVCARTRELFGDAFQYIEEIECHPQGKNAQTELCIQKGIDKTPTWILEKEGVEVARSVGWTSPEKLSEMTGCPPELIKD